MPRSFSSLEKYIPWYEAIAVLAEKGITLRGEDEFWYWTRDNDFQKSDLWFSPEDDGSTIAILREPLINWVPGETGHQTKNRLAKQKRIAVFARQQAEKAKREAEKAEAKAQSLEKKAVINPSTITPRIRFLVLQRDGYRCQLCGASPNDGTTTLEIDHIIPRAKGGSNEMDNLWTLCWECNRGKSDLDLVRKRQ